MQRRTLYDPIRRYVISVSLYGVCCLNVVTIDYALMIALAECWQQETHTFDFPVGKATVNLQDVVVLLRQQIDNWAVISPVMQDVQAICQELLGLTPDDLALGCNLGDFVRISDSDLQPMQLMLSCISLQDIIYGVGLYSFVCR